MRIPLRKVGRARVGTLPNGGRVVAHSVKCYAVGCRRRVRGLLAAGGEGQFYSLTGQYLTNLRDADYACREHGIVDGSAPFLFRDK